MENLYIECECASNEHFVKFSYDKDYDELYCCVFLKEMTFFRRLIAAIKYLFGYKCKFGHFEEVFMSKNDITNLKELLDKINS